MKWEIIYRIVSDNKFKSLTLDLHFTTKHEVGKLFKKNRNGFTGKRNVEFVNAKIID